MKKIVLCFLALISSLTLTADSSFAPESISIYNDMDDGLFGRSIYRNITSTVSDAEFSRAGTYYVNQDSGFFLTAVTINKDIIDQLTALSRNDMAIMVGEYEISIDKSIQDRFSNTKIYRFQSRRTGLDLSFSAEKATPEMIKMIETHYQDNAYLSKLVTDYYKNNYVIAIFAAENVFERWNHDITLADAMLMATLIGDIDQPMWGIHNGNGLLNRALALKK